jgi:hypothetical protein
MYMVALVQVLDLMDGVCRTLDSDAILAILMNSRGELTNDEDITKQYGTFRSPRYIYRS